MDTLTPLPHIHQHTDVCPSDRSLPCPAFSPPPPPPHPPSPSDFIQDPSGVRLSLSLGFALLSHLSRVTWLSKEVIWLLPDASCGLVAAVEAWTAAYQMTVRGHTRGVIGGGGVIRGEYIRWVCLPKWVQEEGGGVWICCKRVT